MTEVRTSSRSERPCAGIEDTPEASIGTGGLEEQRHKKVHSLIDKVYDRNNLIEAWKHVRENKGSAGIVVIQLVIAVLVSVVFTTLMGAVRTSEPGFAMA